MTGRPVSWSQGFGRGSCGFILRCFELLISITGYSFHNDCAISVASAAPLTLLGDAGQYMPLHEKDSAIVFVFPFEQHVHDHGHVRIMVHALLNIINKTEFASYTSVLLFAQNTHRILATSSNMAQEVEAALYYHIPWMRCALGCGRRHTADGCRGSRQNRLLASACAPHTIS